MPDSYWILAALPEEFSCVMTRQRPLVGSKPPTEPYESCVHEYEVGSDDSATATFSSTVVVGFMAESAVLIWTSSVSLGPVTCLPMNWTRVTFHDTAFGGSVGLKYCAQKESL